jgi:hypothetical protein
MLGRAGRAGPMSLNQAAVGRSGRVAGSDADKEGGQGHACHSGALLRSSSGAQLHMDMQVRVQTSANF